MGSWDRVVIVLDSLKCWYVSLMRSFTVTQSLSNQLHFFSVIIVARKVVQFGHHTHDSPFIKFDMLYRVIGKGE